MKNRKDLQRELEAIDEKYTFVLEKKSELEYELNSIINEISHQIEQGNEIRLLHENARRLKHDMKNHLMVVASYISSQNYDMAKKYISEILDKLNTVNSYVETGNLLLNHIINQKLEQARSNNISIKAEIENLSFKKIESFDFSVILSNMLDNAIEACFNEKNPELHINISKKRGYETILIKNKITTSVLEINPKLYSTKPDKSEHGIGISQTRVLVEKYDGLYDFYEDNGFFCACVMLP